MNVPKLTSDKFEWFDSDFQGADRSQVGLFVILIDHLLRYNDEESYYAVWN